MTREPAQDLTFHGIRVNLVNDIKDNFVSLPGSIVQTLESTGIPIQEFGIAISLDEKEVINVGWNGYESQGYLNGQPAVDINPLLAKEVSLISGVQVALRIRRFDKTLTAEEVYVEPETSDDWEIIESHAMFFQDEILHQTRIMTSGEILLCYVDNVVSKFRINSIVPDHLTSARIDTGSLIVIAPRENKKRISKNQVRTEHRRHSVTAKDMNPTNSDIKRSLLSREENISKGLKISLNSKEIKSKYAFLSVLTNSIEFKKSSKQEKSSRSAVKIVVEADSKPLPQHHVEMTQMVWNALCLMPENGCRLNVEFFNDDSPPPADEAARFIIRPFLEEKEYSKKMEQQSVVDQYNDQESIPDTISLLMHSLNHCVITNKMIFSNEKIMIEIVDDSSGQHIPYCGFDVETSNWKYSAHDKVKLSLQQGFQNLNEDSFMDTFSDIDLLKDDDIILQLSAFAATPPTPSNCVVVEGNPGMGKTTILREVARKLVLEQGKYVRYVDCDELLESLNLGKMKQLLQDWCSICYWHQPSMLLLDNAASLFPNVKSEDPQQQLAMQRGGADSTRLALHFINIVQGIWKKNPIAVKVIMTVSNRNSLNNAFFDKHSVCDIFKRKAPDIEERSQIVEFLFAHDYHCMSTSEDLEYRDIALETEGYSPLDLKLLIERLFYEVTLRAHQDYNKITVNKETFLETVKSFTPSSLRGVKLTKNTGVSWNDIGALKGPKRLLLETLEWPSKYAPIFKNSPLQLRSGILLYGYPGCGKTLLASAVAQQCGLNFITVKGPEVLNKYIGASEQNVRDLFEKAQSVKPCVLFFDEFDSIAPKRGHDSTGVTDRIVNQLLTQMDGVEGLDGVYVLAATSRPDLIDPALLRPGRIDRSVLCNIPDEDGRYDILRAVTCSGKMNLDPSVDLRAASQQTTGFSGADLQGLCYNAYLKSVHRHTSAVQKARQLDQEEAQDHGSSDTLECTIVNDGAGGAPTENTLRHVLQCIKDEHHKRDSSTRETTVPHVEGSPIVTITTRDLFDACKETKPSISTTEFYRLQSIYNTFQQDRDGNMPTADDNPNDVGTRTSLM